MSTAIEDVHADVRRELRTIRELINATEQVAPGAPGRVGVRLASSNASMLLLAASFEEFVREVARELAGYILNQPQEERQVPADMSAAVWQRAIYLLKGQKFGKQAFQRADAELQLDALRKFCLSGEVIPGLAELVTYNQNNLTALEFNEMFRRLGISNYVEELTQQAPFLEFFGVDEAQEAYDRLISRWASFYEERNSIAHSIGSYNTTGAGDVLMYVGLFEAVSDAVLTDVLQRCP